MYVVRCLNQLWAPLGPLGLLSGPLYRIKLLALVFLWSSMYTDSIAKSIFHVCLQLIKSVVGPHGPFGDNVWAPVQDKVAGNGIFVTLMYIDSIAKRIIHVCLQLIKLVVGPPGPFGATVWANVQDKVAGIGVLMALNVYRFHCKKNFPCMSSAD